MKLSITHLAPYLPYGLKVQTSWSIDGFGWICTSKAIGLYRDELLLEPYTILHKHIPYRISIDRTSLSDPDTKPLLLPMSSLYTEITHNGKTFIPQKELDWGSWNDEIGYIVSAEYGENSRVAINVLDFIDDYYKLLEWHFDVFGLIDKGLALDKTKIK